MLRKAIDFFKKTIAPFIFPKLGSLIPDRDSHGEEGADRSEIVSIAQKSGPTETCQPRTDSPDTKHDRNSGKAETCQLIGEARSDDEASPVDPDAAGRDGVDAADSLEAGPEDKRKVREKPQTPCDRDSRTRPDLSERAFDADDASEEINQVVLRSAADEGDSISATESVGDSSELSDAVDPLPVPKDRSDGESGPAKSEHATQNVPRNIRGMRDNEAQQPGPARRVASPTRPELLCRATPEGAWTIMIVAAGCEFQIETVVQEGSPLQLAEGACSLSSLRGRLSVGLSDGTQFEIPLFDGKPLCFKLPKGWSGDGRRVRGMSNGHYIVFAPSGWTRTGRTPVEPDACTDTEFTAHYFHVDGTHAAEEIGGFREFTGQLRTVAVGLNGERVFDNSDDGDLFVGEVPSLRTSSSVVWARVGEESRDGWKGENFKPDERSLESVLCGRQGRFYVRVYDAERMIDSTQFRYLRDLKEIRVDGKPYSRDALLLPKLSGHVPAEVRFVGAGGVEIYPVLPHDAAHASARENRLFVDRHPEADRVRCTLSSRTGSVGIELTLPRLWWRLERGTAEHSEWRDTPLDMTRDEFLEHGYAGWSMRLRAPPHLKSARFGFGAGENPAYPLGNKRDPVPLADFADYQCISECRYADAAFEAEIGNKPATLIRIAADPVPKIVSFSGKPKSIDRGGFATLRWETKHAEPCGVRIEPGIGEVESNGTLDVTPSETKTYALLLTADGIEAATRSVAVTVRLPPRRIEAPGALVCNARGGRRKGRGFSRGELRDAGLPSDEELRHSLRVDKRRRTTHAANVEFLRGLINA